MSKFQGKYRSESHRHPNWDYASSGMYFITLVTAKRRHCFGRIENGLMKYGRRGKLVHQEFLKSFAIRDELELDEFVIMPNHLHAIVILDRDHAALPASEFEAEGSIPYLNETVLGPEGNNFDSFDPDFIDLEALASDNRENYYDTPTTDQYGKKWMPIRKPKSISSFVAGFKAGALSAIDDYIDLYDLDQPKYNKRNPLWHPNYHDHIIRNHKAYQNIKNYIINNPKNWKADSANR